MPVPVIVALDFASGAEALDLVNRLGPDSDHYKVGVQSGCHGVVASAQEAAYLSACLPRGTLIVCPGIQLPQAAATDQVRTATPWAAAKAGASHVIIGRAITAAREPVPVFRAALAAFCNGA